MMNKYIMERIVLDCQNNISVRDYFLFYHVSKTTIYHLEKDHKIYVNDKLVMLNEILHKNDKISILLDDIDNNHFKPFKKDIDILYEDDDILIVNKPPFVLIHPDGNSNETIANMVSYYYQKTKQNNGVYVVHRLDYETSGIVVFAKNFLTQTYLSYQLENRLIDKKYICLCHGLINKDGIIDKPIGKDRHQNKQRISKTGKVSKTSYTVLNKNNNQTKLLVTIYSGRKHQIRVHLSSINHPIFGDQIYGIKDNANRLMLHCYQMTFIHPMNLLPFTITCNDSWQNI